jgi:hypothetical protein
MSNFLPNGTVMPHGLLSCKPEDFLRGFNKSYNNTALRFGVIKQIYAINDPHNISGLSTEYDVDVIEQDMNRGIAPVTYKNCLSVDSLGSIADFFEKNCRVQTESDNWQLPLTKGQNGATVLVLCLDAFTGKGIVLGGLNHPDRPTTLVDSQPRLSGEYNGVAVAVNPDGSTSLTFKGATDNYGVPTDPSQGPTTVQIATDGSFSVQNAGATVQLQKSGTVNITCTGPANIIAQGLTTIDGSNINLGVGAAEAVIKGNTFSKLYDNHIHIGNLGVPTSPPLEPMDPSLSTHTFTE